MRRSRQYGFTLLEIMVAMAVFAVLSAMAYGGLQSVLQSRQGLQGASERLSRLQLALLLVERDLGQLSMRSVRVSDNKPLAAMQSPADDNLIEFTSGGWANPLAGPRSSLRRIAYGLEQQRLIRSTWAVLDRTYSMEPLSATLIEGVTELSLRMLDSKGGWHTRWPLSKAQGGDLIGASPVAVEVTIELEDMGSIRRLIPLPTGWLKPAKKKGSES
ncbi:MAG: type II secretion system minor pseudopilin GspJ [Sedimenticola sp.]